MGAGHWWGGSYPWEVMGGGGYPRGVIGGGGRVCSNYPRLGGPRGVIEGGGGRVCSNYPRLGGKCPRPPGKLPDL